MTSPLKSRHLPRSSVVMVFALLALMLSLTSISINAQEQPDGNGTLGTRSNTSRQLTPSTETTILPNGVRMSPVSQFEQGRVPLGEAATLGGRAPTGWTHNANQTIEELVSVACRQNGTDFTRSNSYYRTFTPKDFGVTAPVLVEEIEIGIEISNPGGATQPVSVLLHALSGGLITTNLIDIAREDYTLAAAELAYATMPIQGLIYPDETLVVEIRIPDGLDAGNIFFLGANNNGQTSPSYFRASACGYPQITNLAAIGFPGTHYIINVYGNTLNTVGDSFQVLRNQDLELDKNGNKVPDAWTLRNPTSDKLKTNKTDKIISFNGQNAFMFKGGVGENSSLRQTFKMNSLNEFAGDTFEIFYTVNGSNMPTGGVIQLNIVYDDGSKEKLNFAIPVGTYAYQSLTNADPIVIDAGVKKASFRINNTATSGKFYVDAPRLVWNLDAPTSTRGAATSTDNLIPLPDSTTSSNGALGSN